MAIELSGSLRQERERAPEWLAHQFAIWEGFKAEKQPLLSASDKEGRTSKMAAFAHDFAKGMAVCRESCAAIDGLCEPISKTVVDLKPGQRVSSGRYCRYGIPIDVPIKRLDAILAVDCKLYRQRKDFLPEAEFEIRNREQVPMAADAFRHALKGELFRMTSASSSSSTSNPFNAETIDRVRSAYAEMEGRIGRLVVAKDALDHEDAAKKIQGALELPDRFVFSRITWSWPHLALSIAAKWSKPKTV